MNKIEHIKVKSEMVLEILESYSWNYNNMLDKIQVYTDKINSVETDEERRYYQKELDEIQEKIKCYKEIVSHLEKLF